jgi:hypothetical protein
LKFVVFYVKIHANIITSQHNGMEFIKKKTSYYKLFFKTSEKDYPGKKRLYYKNGILKHNAVQTKTIANEILFASYKLET